MWRGQVINLMSWLEVKLFSKGFCNLYTANYPIPKSNNIMPPIGFIINLGAGCIIINNTYRPVVPSW